MSHTPTNPPTPKAGAAVGEIEVPESEHKHLNMRIAITVALISTFMAGIHIANEDTVIEMHHSEVLALDTWNQFQAKRMREYLAEMGRTQIVALQASLPEGRGQALKGADQKFAADIQKYKKDEAELTATAKHAEATHEEYAGAHDRFDVADGAVAVCLAVLAVTALTGTEWLLYLAWTFAGIGVAAGTWGLAVSHAVGSH